MKAGYGKTVRPVCAADGGKLFIGRLLRPDTEEATEQGKVTFRGGRGGKGLTQGKQPSGSRGSDTEPSCHVDPIGGCAPDRGRFQTVGFSTFDPREEPGALAALAGICAGGAQQ